MKRRNFITTSGLVLGLLAINNKNLFGLPAMEENYKFKELRNNVGIFTEQGGTIGWLNSADGFVVVDAQFPTTAPHVIAELKKLGTKSFTHLINTHHHGDHTAGNISFKDIVGNVVAHNNSLFNQKETAKKQGKESEQLYPSTVFTKSWELKTSDELVKAYYFGAGHTNGDAMIHFQNANIVHMGDLVFNRRYPFIDKAAGANIQSWIEVLQKAMDTFDNDTLFIFGHSLDPEKVTGTKADLAAFQNYLQSLLTLVKTKLKEKKSLEDILKIESISGAPEWKGDGIERSLQAAYEELTA